ncbi:MAG: hypothetical protein AVDCRST_MAG73-806 [uncultured Thermomicrobiales bacterium]|uniref:Uncharacterized protein n=1 Tax=uncultured Thermomicrobiales bacterium TaxID=1645740 RepID=A0A6J4TSC4_9BACT|nr:MAG: hypothetical protein AVDCRST_MAG73-806 [uncultured Thermomicrobiales bacterium]
MDPEQMPWEEPAEDLDDGPDSDWLHPPGVLEVLCPDAAGVVEAWYEGEPGQTALDATRQ